MGPWTSFLVPAKEEKGKVPVSCGENGVAEEAINEGRGKQVERKQDSSYIQHQDMPHLCHLRYLPFCTFYTSKYKFVDRDWIQYKFELPEQSIV